MFVSCLFAALCYLVFFHWCLYASLFLCYGPCTRLNGLKRESREELCKSVPDYPLCRLYHGRGSPSQGAPADQLPTFMSVRLKVTTTKKKKGRQLFGEKSAPPQIRKSWLRVREKGPALRWYGAPEWLIRP